MLATDGCARSSRYSHPTEKHKLLLATCYYCNGLTARAAAVLDGATRPKKRYFLACCCLQLDRLEEAENPFLWSAYEKLGELGANLESSRLFSASNYFNCAGTTEKCDRKWKHKPEFSEDSDGTHLLNDGEHNYGEKQRAEDQSSTAAFASRKRLSQFVLVRPKSAISTFNTCEPLAYKTQTMEEDNNNDNHGNMHTATVVKKRRVIEDIRATARQRKKHRRPLADSDENI
ncbi:hypothetical protein PsorP6_010055 [Peronosclerospora sorghi]|uniref:Uncharacterized protein n=1 Tax=Peronosclerospora sorghi TaxID=230839 RepID=A0ACC0VWC2_9STRA|nr:hypothetical protein PsorP6_010055 [Peronosclerospora sorghi]